VSDADRATLPAALEAELLAGVKAGGAARREAIRRMFRELREPLFALCLHVTGRRSDAEEALGRCFEAADLGLPGFQGASRLSTWLYRIALRAAIRVRAVRPSGPPPRTEATADGVLAGLPAGPCAVLSLFAVEGLSREEVADILGISEASAWSRLHAARRSMEGLPNRPEEPKRVV